MKNEEYKSRLKKKLRPRTVTFLTRDKQVLLGLKKKGFGKGYYLGIGGKVEEKETIEEAARREVKEEIVVDLGTVKYGGILNFYFPHIEDESWNQQVHIFVTQEWIEQPHETDEIKPEWFDKNNIPLEKMWDDAQYWLPQVLNDKEVEGDFLFDDTLKVVDHVVKEY